MLCFDCPRKCGVDRSEKKGFCGEGDKIRISKIIENFSWEEPCISGDKGALAIFFSGCNLRCEFCQNYSISHVGKGDYFSPKQFRKLLESYDLKKFSSIDLITPTHFSSLLYEALKGFVSPIPIVWNSSGYESEEMIEKIGEVVDVFLPDFKYYSSELSKKLSLAEDYFVVAKNAIKKMRQIKKENIFDEDVLKSGLLIRHLVLPGYIEDSKMILSTIKEDIDKPLISLMSQYVPIGKNLTRKIYPLEYKIVLDFAEKIGLKDGYFQDFDSANKNFIPDF